MFYIHFTIGSIRVVHSRSGSISLVLGGTLCAVVVLDIGHIRCWVFRLTPIAKLVACDVWLRSCSLGLFLSFSSHLAFI